MLIQITFGQKALFWRSATDASGPRSRRDWGPVTGVWAARGSSASLPKYSRYCIARTVLFWQYLHTLNTVTGNYGTILLIFDLPKNRNATVWLSRMWAMRTIIFLRLYRRSRMKYQTLLVFCLMNFCTLAHLTAGRRKKNWSHLIPDPDPVSLVRVIIAWSSGGPRTLLYISLIYLTCKDIFYSRNYILFSLG